MTKWFKRFIRRRPIRLTRIKNMREYSKKVITAMVLLWFIGAVFGGVVVIMQLIKGSYSVDLPSLLNYIGLPMGGGVVMYMAKSAFENHEKIKQNFIPDDGFEQTLNSPGSRTE